MHHAAPLSSARENVFLMAASSARRLSYADLSAIAAASGTLALAAAAFGVASWMLLAACYVGWCFAGWGILFHSSTPRTLAWRTLEWIIVGSASAVCVVIGIGAFFWALGPRWML
jgi:hypothetical protein